MSAGPASRPWRRFLRFSVRGLLIVVVVIGAGLGWIVRSAHIQRAAVAAIRGTGGSATYDWQWRGHGELFGEPPAPEWLTNLIGVDYFGHVTVVVLSGTGTDATAAQVGKLSRLERLYLDDAHVTDAGLAHLEGLSSLSLLLLVQAQVTDAGVAHLKGLSNLSVLGLDKTQVTDAGLAHLKGLNNLSSLGLNKTGVTDVGVNDLKKALPRPAIHR